MARAKLYDEDGTPIPIEELCPAPGQVMDPCDGLLPTSGGLIHDLIRMQRGSEVPTLYGIWTSLFVLSAALKREAWLKFGRGRLFTNYYTLIVGPPAMKKGQALDDALDMMFGFQEFVQDEQLRKMKTIFSLQDKMTPEFLFEAMSPRKRGRKLPPFILKNPDGTEMRAPNGKKIVYRATSELMIFLHEMAVTAGRRKYNEGLIEDLLTLYDPRDYFEWSTVKRGTVPLRDMHTTFCALTTPKGFRDSIPEVATSDGFLSRCIVVYQAHSPRRFRRPVEDPSLPSFRELKKRLAWIAERAIGEYDLSPEADAYFERWYERFKDRQETDYTYNGVFCRLFSLLLKVALLIYLQRYDRDPDSNLVTLQDIKDADRLIMGTVRQSAKLLGHLTNGEKTDTSMRLEEFLKRHKKITRSALLKNLHIRALDVNEALDQLVQEGSLKVSLGGKTQPAPSRNGEETYEWIEEAEEDLESGEQDREDLQGVPLGEEDSEPGRRVQNKRTSGTAAAGGPNGRSADEGVRPKRQAIRKT